MTTATPTRTKRFISQEVKTEILEKIASNEMTVAQAAQHYHVARGSIYRWVNLEKDTPSAKAGAYLPKETRTAISQGTMPPRPEVGAIDEKGSMTLLLLGQRYGFDSPIFCELCRKEGVMVEDIKRLDDWSKATKNKVVFDQPFRFTIDELAEQNKGLKDQVATLTITMQELESSKSEQESALAKYAMEVLLKKGVAIH